MLKILHDKIDFSNFPKNDPRYSSEKKAQFGYVKVDTGSKIMHAFLGEKKKSYQLFLGDASSPDIRSLSRKTVKKGCPGRAAEKLATKDILGLIKSPGVLKTSFNTLSSKKHIIRMIKMDKKVSNSFDNSAYYRSCGMCNIPFFCTLENISECNSIDCRRNKLLVDIWHRLVR